MKKVGPAPFAPVVAWLALLPTEAFAVSVPADAPTKSVHRFAPASDPPFLETEEVRCVAHAYVP